MRAASVLARHLVARTVVAPSDVAPSDVVPPVIVPPVIARPYDARRSFVAVRRVADAVVVRAAVAGSAVAPPVVARQSVVVQSVVVRPGPAGIVMAVVVASIAAAGACTPLDGGARADAGVPDDAGSPDGGGSDGGDHRTDAGAGGADGGGGAGDAGPVVDGGAAVDAGPTVDGGAALDVDAGRPTPAGCIDDVANGDRVYACEGLTVDARIPAACQAPGCGLILQLHGDTGNGLLMDGHTELRARAAQHGYIVVAPTGPPFGFGYPGSTWREADDASLVAIVERFRDVFRVDPKKIHVTGFSRGGFVTWRLICDHSDLFASAAPAGAGFGGGFGEDTCFDGDAPARRIPIAFLVGRTDASVGYATMTGIRDAIVAEYDADGPTTVDGDATYVHERWTKDGGVVLEVWDHEYETAADGPWADAAGHCIPGSTTDPYAAQYAIPCVLPNSFAWGAVVMDFFRAHPAP